MLKLIFIIITIIIIIIIMIIILGLVRVISNDVDKIVGFYLHLPQFPEAKYFCSHSGKKRSLSQLRVDTEVRFKNSFF